MELVEEYIANYDLEDGIDENTLYKVLHLSIGKLLMDVEMTNDFRPRSYFKGEILSFEKNQGWQMVETLTSKLMEWMYFVQKQLGLNRHTTYISKCLLFVVIGMLQDMVFN